MSTTRTYVVTSSGGMAPRLIRTTHPNRAVAHVAAGVLTARAATADDIETLFDMGIRVERIQETATHAVAQSAQEQDDTTALPTD